jgi:hypothetical protein
VTILDFCFSDDEGRLQGNFQANFYGTGPVFASVVDEGERDVSYEEVALGQGTGLEPNFG